MKFLTNKTLALLLALLAGSARCLAADGDDGTSGQNARELYNQGTKLLNIQKFEAAETKFQAALATQDEPVQRAALYNVAYARFGLGVDYLKKGPDAQGILDQGKTALVAGDHAIQSADAALAQNDVAQMVNAYMEGRGARHQMREAEKAVADAMQIFGNTLRKWQRSADDFKSAAELNPADTNAQQNAEVVERNIAKLVDLARKLQEMAGELAGKRGALGQKMSKMRGQMPGWQAPPGPGGEDGDEDEDITPGSLTGMKENASREGTEMQVSPDQASQMLDGLPVDASRRLPMNGAQQGKPGEHNGRNW